MSKIIELVKNHPVLSWAIGTVAVALVVALIVALVVSGVVSTIFGVVGSDGGEESSSAFTDISWGDGPTEGIPAFSPSNDSVSSIKGNKNSVAAYYTEVTGEQVNEYTALIERECGVSFSTDQYPRSAVYGDRIIAIHYNVTEMKMSVTVVRNGDTEQ